MVEKVVVMNCHVQQKVKVGKTVCDEASVVPWEVHSRDKVQHTEKRDWGFSKRTDLVDE